MQINGQVISEKEVAELLPIIYELCENHDIPATFFEITTILAFLFYEKHQAQVVVLETGLGGRLDATNVIMSPALSVITSIGLEHTRILGDTVELIAKEKGGIIKSGRPILVGPHCPQAVLQQCAQEVGAGPYFTPDQVLGGSSDNEITDYDEENQRIASASLKLLQQNYPELLIDLTEEEISQGVCIRPPCRFEEVQKKGLKVILDVAHNPPAMEYLVVKLQKTYPESSFRFVAGMSSDKDISQCARSLLKVADSSCIHLVEAAHPRAAKLEDILAAEPSLNDCHCDLEDRSIKKQVMNAMSISRECNEILVVCGSVFLMAEAREALGFDEPKDSSYIAEMAGAGVRHGQENFGNTTMVEEQSKRK
jgi:dihydrofolate synthase/folylpolyglutamate synthase